MYFLVRPINTEIICHLCGPTWQSLRKVRVCAVVGAVGRGSPTPTRTAPRTGSERGPRPLALGPQESPDRQVWGTFLQESPRHLQPQSSLCWWEARREKSDASEGRVLFEWEHFPLTDNTTIMFLRLQLCLNSLDSISFWETTEPREDTRKTALGRRPAGRQFETTACSDLWHAYPCLHASDMPWWGGLLAFCSKELT